MEGYGPENQKYYGNYEKVERKHRIFGKTMHMIMLDTPMTVNGSHHIRIDYTLKLMMDMTLCIKTAVISMLNYMVCQSKLAY